MTILRYKGRPRLPKDYLNRLVELHTGKVCESCGAPFNPIHPSHRYCRQCWHKGRAGALTLKAAKHLREVKS